jgi:hypothetical protein
LGFSLTRVLPEPARRNLEDMNLDSVPAAVPASVPARPAASPHVEEPTEVPSILNLAEPSPAVHHTAVSGDPAAAPSHATG